MLNTYILHVSVQVYKFQAAQNARLRPFSNDKLMFTWLYTLWYFPEDITLVPKHVENTPLIFIYK